MKRTRCCIGSCFHVLCRAPLFSHGASNAQPNLIGCDIGMIKKPRALEMIDDRTQEQDDMTCLGCYFSQGRQIYMHTLLPGRYTNTRQTNRSGKRNKSLNLDMCQKTTTRRTEASSSSKCMYVSTYAYVCMMSSTTSRCCCCRRLRSESLKSPCGGCL